MELINPGINSIGLIPIPIPIPIVSIPESIPLVSWTTLVETNTVIKLLHRTVIHYTTENVTQSSIMNDCCIDCKKI